VEGPNAFIELAEGKVKASSKLRMGDKEFELRVFRSESKFHESELARAYEVWVTKDYYYEVISASTTQIIGFFLTFLLIPNPLPLKVKKRTEIDLRALYSSGELITYPITDLYYRAPFSLYLPHGRSLAIEQFAFAQSYPLEGFWGHN
jgi:hypothetical protein